MKRTKVLITGFIGKPKCMQSKLDSAHERYNYTKNSIEKIRSLIQDREIYVALTGDVDMAHQLRLELNNTCHIQWFSQDDSLCEFGKGRLEHELIKNAINFWHFDNNGDKLLKITAKYEIANLKRILSFIDKYELPVVGWEIRGEQMIDTRCFSFLAASYNQFHADNTSINDANGVYYEHYMYNCLIENSGIFLPVGLGPLVYGISGSENTYVEPSMVRKFASAMFGWIYG